MQLCAKSFTAGFTHKHFHTWPASTNESQPAEGPVHPKSESQHVDHTLIDVECDMPSSMWWLEDKNCPNIAHACHKRRLKWVPRAWGYRWVTLSLRVTIQRPGPPGWGLGMGLTAPTYKNPVVRKSKEETASSFWLLRKAKAKAYKGLPCQRWWWWW
jgi:hypothetical protein